MRIVGGDFKGRRFSPPAKTPARPTTDIAKEGLFNTLMNMIDLEGIDCLELFGGTGSISYELASRGASSITFVEQDRGNINFVSKTIKELGIADSFSIVKWDAFKYLKSCTAQYDFIFADPPYDLANIDDIPELVFQQNILAIDGIFVLEHSPRNNYEQHPNFLKTKKYGTCIFSYFNNPS